MKPFTYDFTIKAATQQEADAKMRALQVFASKLETSMLEKFASVVKNEPEKIDLAIKFLG